MSKDYLKHILYDTISKELFASGKVPELLVQQTLHDSFQRTVYLINKSGATFGDHTVRYVFATTKTGSLHIKF